MGYPAPAVYNKDSEDPLAESLRHRIKAAEWDSDQKGLGIY